MRTATAKSCIKTLRSQAEDLGWYDGIALLTRAEDAVSEGGRLTKRGAEHSRARKAITESLDTVVCLYAHYRDVYARLLESKQQAASALSTMMIQNPRALSATVREHATLHAYNDEKAGMFAELNCLDTQLDNLGDPQAESQRLDLLAQEGIRDMETGIADMLASIGHFFDELESSTS